MGAVPGCIVVQVRVCASDRVDVLGGGLVEIDRGRLGRCCCAESGVDLINEVLDNDTILEGSACERGDEDGDSTSGSHLLHKVHEVALEFGDGDVLLGLLVIVAKLLLVSCQQSFLCGFFHMLRETIKI